MSERLKTEPGPDYEGRLRSELLNLPQNLTPGFKKTTGNPGETFDPQIALTGNTTDTTFESDELLKFDNAARKLDRLDVSFPSANALGEEMYNERLDNQVAEALTTFSRSRSTQRPSPEQATQSPEPASPSL